MAQPRKYKDSRLIETVQIRVTPEQKEWANSMEAGFMSDYLRKAIDYAIKYDLFGDRLRMGMTFDKDKFIEFVK